MEQQINYINEEWNEADELDLVDGSEGTATDGEERYEHFSITVDKGQSMLRLDKYLTIHMEKCSRNRIQAARSPALRRHSSQSIQRSLAPRWRSAGLRWRR